MQLKKRIGVFVPPPLEAGEPKSIHNPGIGRITKQMHTRLWDLLLSHSSPSIEVVPDLSFRNAIVYNNQVVFHDSKKNSIDAYFWYSEVDRKPNSFDISTLKMLARSIEVIRDPTTYENALDKHISFSLLRNSKVPVADSLLVNSANVHEVEHLLSSWNMIVLKPRRGGFGKGVTLLDSFESVRDTLEYINATSSLSLEGGFHLERFYENDIKLWTSVTIIDGHIVYGYRKNQERFVSLGNGKMKVYDTDEIGGSVHLCEVTPLHEKIALDAYKALGLKVVGFDMIWHEDRPIIVDVNTFPGMYQDLFDAQGIDGGEMFYQMIVGDEER